jgi:hypothetical protein
MIFTARALFLVVGALWLVIGVLTPLLLGRIGPELVFVSTRADTEFFGAHPRQVLDGNPQMAVLRVVVLRTLAGMLVASGVLVLALAWFGLAGSDRWALGALTVVGLAVLPFWWVALAPYRAAGVRLGLGDIPPLMWVPAILMPVASALGWLGVVSR